MVCVCETLLDKTHLREDVFSKSTPNTNSSTTPTTHAHMHMYAWADLGPTERGGESGSVGTTLLKVKGNLCCKA